MKKLTKIGVLLLAMVMILTACGGGATTEKAAGTEEATEKAAVEETAAEETSAADTTVGFIFVGPVGDGGWSDAHNEGRLYVEEQLGIKTLYKESVPEGPEVEKVIADMVDQGASVIFATSFGYMDYVEKMAKEFPDVKFLHCSGYKSADNMNNYFGRMYEPRFLSGIVAGLQTESNQIGYVGAFEIPEVIRGINAFTLGVQAVNPEATVNVKWTHTWYDPAKEKEAAKALLDEGCDVISQHQDTTGPLQAAQERGMFAIGYNTISEDKAPDSYLTAPIWNWGEYYATQIELAMNGEWTAENVWLGMSDGLVELAPLSKNVKADIAPVVEEYQAKILNGEFKVFEGVLTKQDGTTVGEEGKAFEDGDLLSMNYFLQGVNGKIEN